MVLEENVLVYSRTCIKIKLLVPFSGTTTVCTTKNNQDINHNSNKWPFITGKHIQNKGTLSLSPHPQLVHLLFEQQGLYTFLDPGTLPRDPAMALTIPLRLWGGFCADETSYRHHDRCGNYKACKQCRCLGVPSLHRVNRLSTVVQHSKSIERSDTLIVSHPVFQPDLR